MGNVIQNHPPDTSLVTMSQISTVLPPLLDPAPADQTAGDPLSDDQLVVGGLVPVQCWIRSKSSKNALRIARMKQNKAAEGIRQINVQAPEAVHDLIKAVARAAPPTLARIVAIMESDLTQKAADQHAPDVILSVQQRKLIALGKRIARMRGWRRSVARILLWLDSED